jgi:hypothetical protein
MGLFRTAQESAAARIYDLSDPASVNLVGYSGRGKDDELEPGSGLLVDAVKNRWPTVCADDALDEIGRTLDLERYFDETDATYRERLEGAFDAWAWAGTAKGIEDQLVALMHGLDAAAADATVWEDWEGVFSPWTGGWYSRFLVTLRWSPWSTLVLDGDTSILDACTLGSTATEAEILTVKRVILKWKDAHSLPVRVVVILGPCDLLDVDATLGLSMLCGAEQWITWPMMLLLGDAAYVGMTLGSYVLG